MPGTSLAELVKRGKIALKAKSPTLASVASALVEEQSNTVVDFGLGETPVPFPPLPSLTMISAAEKEALADLESIFNSVNIDRRRTLTQVEITLAIQEYEVVNTVAKLAKDRLEILKETVRVHLDVEAEEMGIALSKEHHITRQGERVVLTEATPRHNGHYALAGIASVPNEPKAFHREVRQASTSVSSDRLNELYAAGEVSREDYLALTREVRVLDEDKAMTSLERKPELLGLIARIASKSGLTTALSFKKRKVT